MSRTHVEIQMCTKDWRLGGLEAWRLGGMYFVGLDLGLESPGFLMPEGLGASEACDPSCIGAS